LHVAAGQFNLTDVHSFLAASSKLQAENNEGHTALDVAVLKKKESQVTFLLLWMGVNKFPSK